ncbi:PP2C family protein-serine/threonine phosphatase [Glycomyces buryatensis]|uniref:Serine/threonine-protein phosphatase n=1 Tax=Glycomyces buryatensis TaxID=2570927 RepID=A0A4S8Q7L5_9ACTN|nr:PP2C family protein-serine/threonine phosphatase [Glycomyces buryatensis]THV40130.1 serine/threonine-protein phosphatase [Glycomyces buryatensis]
MRRLDPEDARLIPGTRLPIWVRLLPILLLIGSELFQISSPDRVHAGIAVAIVPVLSAFVLGPVWTGVIAVLSLLLVAAPIPLTEQFDGDDIVAVGVVCVTSVGIAWLRQRFEARLVTMQSVSEVAQLAVLPDLPERVSDLDCAGLYHSAQRGARIGGDLFDVRPSPYGARMILGDVQGHGLPAVSTAAVLLSTFHEAILDESDLEGVAARLERRILIDAEQGYIPELFASVLLVEFTADSRQMRLLSCGHPAPLLLRGDRVEELDLKPGPVLGLRLQPRERHGSSSMRFLREETLLAYSDGVIEARDKAGHFYPLADRLRGLVVPPSPRRLVEFVWEDVARFATRMDDDVSLLAIRRAGSRTDSSPERNGALSRMS